MLEEHSQYPDFLRWIVLCFLHKFLTVECNLVYHPIHWVAFNIALPCNLNWIPS